MNWPSSFVSPMMARRQEDWRTAAAAGGVMPDSCRIDTAAGCRAGLNAAAEG